MAAKLNSLKGVVWLGVLVFLFGVASAFYPPLKLIVGSVTTSAACALAGLALIFLPTLIAGNELLILGVSIGVVALWFVAHRHGHLRGSLDTLLKKDE
jgi:DNA-binding transcriptional LysR family regulator